MNIKTLAIVTPLAVSAFALTGCYSNENNKATEEPSSNKETKELSVSKNENSASIENSIHNDNAKPNKKIDINKPNLPRINSDIIQYKNLSGKLVDVEIVDNATISLYSAIQKHSTTGSPEIKDIGDFYADVESNISKAQNDKPDRVLVDAGMFDLSRQNIIALRHLQCSNMFNKLFDIFTSPKSEGGEAITVKEYTKMMDAWSSTGIVSND